MAKIIDLTGQRFGRLVVIERAENKVFPSGQKQPTWRCRCDCGAETVVQGGHLRGGQIKSCGCLLVEARASLPRPRGQFAHAWKGDNIGYRSMHGRIREQRGSARGYWCMECKSRRADAWAYLHVCDEERWGQNGRGDLSPYCLHPEHYAALCKPCHVALDEPERLAKWLVRRFLPTLRNVHGRPRK